MAIEISDYYVWQISVAEYWEHKLVVWGACTQIHITTPDITIVISSTVPFIHVINLQVVSDENSTTILVVGTFSY